MRQDAHHEAQTFSIQTLPFISSGVKARVGWCSCSSLNAGAGLSMKGEGTVRGSRVRPTAKNTASARKSARGTTNLSAFIASGLRGGCAGGRHRLLARAIAAVREGDEAAQRHEEGATPDPVHERLVVDAHTPGVALHLLSQRDVEVAQEARVDVGLGHGLARGLVEAL